MVAFPLANLNSTLLEMVITKLDDKSYFRLQQTCRGMNNFIRRNKKISVHLKRDYKAYAGDKISCYDHCGDIDVDTLFGTRLRSLEIHGENCFEYICDCLKKYRLTFAEIFIYREWTKKQILTILKITKPLTIFLNSEGSNRYEKTVCIDLNQDQVAIVVPKLLLTFSKVNIDIYYSEQPFELLRTVLQILRSQPLPNLRQFDFYTKGNIGANMDRDDLEKEFREFNLTVKEQYDDCIDVVVELPPHFPEEISCEVMLTYERHSCYIHFYCGVKDVQNWAFWNK